MKLFFPTLPFSPLLELRQSMTRTNLLITLKRIVVHVKLPTANWFDYPTMQRKSYSFLYLIDCYYCVPLVPSSISYWHAVSSVQLSH